MREYGIVCMIVMLVAVVMYQYYILREGFADAQQAVPATPTTPLSPPASQANNAIADILQKAITATPEAQEATEKQDKAKLLRDIQQIVHNELIQQKKMTSSSSQPLLTQNQDGSLMYTEESPASQQGKEMSVARPKWCPHDMNDYIRKDSIPCWNCNIA